jgi:hypothetical protein
MPALAVTPKFTWQTIIMKLPASSPYFTHDRCTGCTRKNGSQPRSSTIKHICHVVADRVRESDPDSRAYLSVKGIAWATSRDPHTVIMVIGHLRKVGLLDRARRGGGFGVAREAPSIYCLTIPDPALLTLAKVSEETILKVKQMLAEQEARTAAGEPAYQWWDRPG